MHDFYYVSKKETALIKKEIIEIIQEVQNAVRKKFTFKFTFIGSSSRNMITQDKKSNIGFDFDVNIEVNDEEENYNAKEIRCAVKNAIDRVAPKYGYKHCEDSTRVLTIKKVDKSRNKIVHSCDFAIVYNGDDGSQQYIRFNKDKNNYTWEFQGDGYEKVPQKIDWLKNNDHWQELKDYYIEKKNKNNDTNKHSRTIFFEAIHEMCSKNKY